MNPLTGIFGKGVDTGGIGRAVGQRGGRRRRLKSLEARVSALEGGGESQVAGAVQQNAQAAQDMPAGVGQMGGILQSNEAGIASGAISSMEPDEEQTFDPATMGMVNNSVGNIGTKLAAQDMFGTGFMRDQSLGAAKLIEGKTL